MEAKVVENIQIKHTVTPKFEIEDNIVINQTSISIWVIVI